MWQRCTVRRVLSRRLRGFSLLAVRQAALLSPWRLDSSRNHRGQAPHTRLFRCLLVSLCFCARGHTRSRVRPGVSVWVVGHAQPRGHRRQGSGLGSVWGGGTPSPAQGPQKVTGQAWGQCGGGHTHPRGHTRSRVRPGVSVRVVGHAQPRGHRRSQVRPGVSVRVVGHAQPRGHKQSWVRPGVSVWGGGGHTQGVGSPGQPWDSSCGYCEYSGQSERLCPGRRSLGVAGLGLGSPGTRGAAAPGHTPQERALLIVSTAPPPGAP